MKINQTPKASALANIVPAFDQSEICDGCGKTASECSCQMEKRPTTSQMKVLTNLRDGRQPRSSASYPGGQHFRGNTNRGVFCRCLDYGWVKYVNPKPGGKKRLSGRYELTKLGLSLITPTTPKPENTPHDRHPTRPSVGAVGLL